MFVYGKFLMFKLTERDWTVRHTNTFVVITQKNKSNKNIHLKILGKKKTYDTHGSSQWQIIVYEALEIYFFKIQPRRNHLAIKPVS